jgi:hypothetical protein
MELVEVKHFTSKDVYCTKCAKKMSKQQSAKIKQK